MTLGERIRTTREEKGITLNGLARRAGVSPAYVSQLENEVSKDPSVWIVLKIAEALEVPLSYLTEGKSIEMRCETCFFLDAGNFRWKDSDFAGHCKRYPPVPSTHYDGNRPSTIFEHVPVEADDWCGEWKPKQ